MSEVFGNFACLKFNRLIYMGNKYKKKKKMKINEECMCLIMTLSYVYLLQISGRYCRFFKNMFSTRSDLRKNKITLNPTHKNQPEKK